MQGQKQGQIYHLISKSNNYCQPYKLLNGIALWS